jgi:hypothetical protein
MFYIVLEKQSFDHFEFSEFVRAYIFVERRVVT